jgi:dUTP pyrophosphatase
MYIIKTRLLSPFKTTTHCVFDEAGMTLPLAALTPGQITLQKLGYRQPYSDADNYVSDENVVPEAIPTVPITTAQQSESSNHPVLKVKCLSALATIPSRANDGAVGYDVYSAAQIVIPPAQHILVPLDIAITPPEGTYVQILSRSELSVKHHIDVTAGTIDSDYMGNVMVPLYNSGAEAYAVNVGDRIAQMVVVNHQTPTVIQVSELSQTERGNHRIGSTGLHNNQSAAVVKNLNAPPPTLRIEPDVTAPTEPFYNIYFSHDPFDSTIDVDIPIKGDHATLGMQFTYCDNHQRYQLKDMALSTPGSRIPKWRRVLRNAYLLNFQEFSIHTQADLEHAITQARLRKLIKATMVFATDKSYGVHPIDGVLQIHLDQMNTIAKHLEDIAKDRSQKNRATNTTYIGVVHSSTFTPNSDSIPIPEFLQNKQPNPTLEPDPTPKPAAPPPLIPDEQLAQTFSKKQLKQRSDWPDWQQSIYKQLDQYWNQGMFSQPLPSPINSNALQMLWCYNLKVCGTKKARMVCNGSPRQKGTVTLGHTYANALDSASERLFWAIVASEGLIAIGADVSNAFAEAPGPKAPLYLYIDDNFRDWWVNHLHRPPFPSACNAVHVHNAIQGHPESPRLWERHIDQILRDIGMTPTTHEPCLYSSTIDDQRVLFLRQVDDFSVASRDTAAARTLIDSINAKMRIEVKHLGLIDRFNGMDVHQTRHYMKITCEKYLYKMIKSHEWLIKGPHPINPIPLPADSAYLQRLEQAVVPNSILAKTALQHRMGFKYRQVMGEVIYPTMKCRPEIINHAIKLSQYLENPADEHYHALRDLVAYLAATIEDGIYYWHKHPVMELPDAPLPTIKADNYDMPSLPFYECTLYGYVDSDWGSHTTHRKSITGVLIMFAGGAVGYRCKYQDTIAHSSTEAEFAIACDAGKMILFFRSLLYDLGIEQEQATVLYEDNNGTLLMANAQQPTQRTRHMDIKKFALLDWVDQDILILHDIKTAENAADGLTKPLAKQLFYQHADTMMGRRVPDYVTTSSDNSKLNNG